MLMIGLVGTAAVNEAGADGLFYGGGLLQLGKQAVAVVAAAAFAFVATLLIAWLVKRLVGFRVGAEVEAGGIDEAEHAETAYEFSPLTSSSSSIMGARPSSITAAPEESAR
jgi:Amt family ammonium transporter